MPSCRVGPEQVAGGGCQLIQPADSGARRRTDEPESDLGHGRGLASAALLFSGEQGLASSDFAMRHWPRHRPVVRPVGRVWLIIARALKYWTGISQHQAISGTTTNES